jgi:hypothetical protein
MTRRSLAIALGATLAGAVAADSPYVSADPSAPAVTRANLPASERFWPYQVELREAWPAGGGAPPVPAGTLGVLIRVEPQGVARIDFGRDGRHEVPIDKTDLVERADRVRRGELWKPAPNFVHAIGARLVDPESDPPRALEPLALLAAPGLLSVFADPQAAAFGEIATALAPLRGRHGVVTVLFPQGGHPTPETRDRLRRDGWSVPFVMDALAEGYTRSQLDDGVAPPAVMLHTREGRMILQSAWREGLAEELRSAIDRAFGGGVAPAALASPAP